MKAFLLLAVSLSSVAAQAAEIRCASADETVVLTVKVPEGLDLANIRNLEVKEATVHVSDRELVNDRAYGGLQWDDREGGIAVRTLGRDQLVSVRTGGFVDGVAKGRFEDVLEARVKDATCRFVSARR